MEFIIVTSRNEHLYQPQMLAFFQARHLVYAEELGWVPRSPDGLEYDQFDTAEAEYLLVMDGGEFVAGSRLVPTHLPHLLSEAFPDSCNIQPMPRDPAVAEWTRGFVVPSRRDRGSVRILAGASAAVLEHCLARGFTRVGGIQDEKWLPLWKKMGWSIHVHGDPIMIDGRPWLPVYFDVTEEAMLAARRLAGLSHSLLADAEKRAA